MDFKLKSRSRRGLSSVVGTLFFIVLMVAAFTALLAAFSYQNTLIDTQKTVADLEVAKARETFVLSGDIIPGNLLELNVTNRGTNPVEVADLWVIEKSGSYLAHHYDTSDIGFTNSAIPIGSVKNIASDLTDTFSLPAYSVKVVSKLGTVVTADIPQVGDGPQGPQGDQGQACWDLNNDGDGDLILSPVVTINGVDYDTEDLDNDGDVDIMDCVGENGGEGEEIVLDPRFLQKPEIFPVFPSSNGAAGGSTGNNKALWGAIIANPTDVDMYVSKIVINVVSPRANSNDIIFPTPCVTSIVTPAGISWTCSSNNQVTWRNNTSLGTLISPRSAVAFFTTVEPGTLGGSASLDSAPITASVFTSMGQFGKTGYVSSMISDKAPIVNVFVTNTLVESSAVLNTGVAGSADIASNSILTLKVALADLNDAWHSTTNRNYISAGARLVINVPKAFSNVQITSFTGFNNPVSVQVYPDGSTQIIGTLTSNLGDAASKQAKIIEFTTLGPTVTDTKMYLFPILANGDGIAGTSGSPTNFEIGPMQEYIVRVHP